MDLKIAPERILILNSQITPEVAEQKAVSKKIDAFGTLEKFTGFFSRPQDSDFEIEYKEFRFQPFWHIASNARYVYDRNSHYQYDKIGQEVKSVTFQGEDYDVTNGHMHIPVLEHCNQELREEQLIDAVTGKNDVSLKSYILHTSEVVGDKNILDVAGANSVLVPPQIRVSGIFREMLSQMIQGIQADVIFEEKIEISSIDLYYRPIYAFQFHWKSKNKKAIVEIDAITGVYNTGSRTFSEYIGKALDRDFLFDIGADAAGIFIPGGSIAVKAAKKLIDRKK